VKTQPPPPLALALTIARLATGWTGKELATVAGMAQSTLSQYESGRTLLTWERYKEVLSFLSQEPDLAERALLSAKLVQAPLSTSGELAFLTQAEARLIRKATAIGGSEAVDVLRDGLTKAVQSERIRQDRDRAQALWRRLKKYSISERRILVEGADDYHEWALSVLLCFESERATANDPNEALGLAELALLVAEKLEGSERWRFRLSGHAWIFIGNARRVANKISDANEAFGCGWHFWKAGEDSLGILDEGYLYDLEASLRRDERCFESALELHEKALSLAKKGRVGAILLSKALTLKEMGEYGQAVEVLRKASEVINAEREPRLFFALQFNLAVVLLLVGRPTEAIPLVRNVRALSRLARNTLDFFRGLWLEANLAGALGDRAKAVMLLEQVRRELLERSLPYDYALASLDLALVYREDRRYRDIKLLASDMVGLFKQHGIHREALGALILFQESLDAEYLTVAEVKRLQTYLERVQREPTLCFES
jgi:transcriptional regulator with XRE-family HTH domain